MAEILNNSGLFLALLGAAFATFMAGIGSAIGVIFLLIVLAVNFAQLILNGTFSRKEY